MALTNFPLLTVQDAIDYVLDQVTAGDSSPRSRRLAWHAVRDAYSELPMRRNWRYLYRPFTIETVASITTGTITYDYTGGASERLVTRSTGTLPTDLVKYALYVSGKRYTIESRLSATTFTLSEKDCPTTDLAAGTEYTLVRDTYELPDNLRKVLSLYDTSAPGRLIECVDPGDIMQERRIARTASVPLMYSVYRSERYASSMAIHFAPSTTSAITYQALGLFWPEPLKVLSESNGTVATTSGSATVTGTSTTFSADHVGAVMRFSATGVTAIPTDIMGEIDKNRLHPYVMQRVIKSRESATSLTLEQDADTTLSGSGFRISSRIDIEPGAMRNAFLRCCEARYATQDRSGHKDREAMYERALALAMAADQRLEETTPIGFHASSLADVVASADLTTGGSSTSSAV
jgi:hypothetical protein